jgi:dTDP-4-dehydrorhamnose reductase
MSTWLVTGAGGVLGGYLLGQLGGRDVVAWRGSRDVDLADRDATRGALLRVRPSVVIHAAAMARVGDCHRDPDRADRVNHHATAELAEACAGIGARLVHVSTDMVFGGDAAPYREADAPAPLSVYGGSKAKAEAAVVAHPQHLAVRISVLYGPSRSEKRSFFDEMLRALREQRPLTLFEDEWRTPLDLVTAARGIVALAESSHTGIVHLGGPERMSRLEMGRRLARLLNLPDACIRPTRRDDVPADEPRPRDLSLDSSKWRAAFAHLPWPAYEDGLRGLGLF